jgi:hypothetical protein
MYLLASGSYISRSPEESGRELTNIAEGKDLPYPIDEVRRTSNGIAYDGYEATCHSLINY